VYVFPAHAVAGDLRSVVPCCPFCHPCDHDILTLNSSSITTPDLPDSNLVLNFRSFRIFFSNSVCATKKACYAPMYVVLRKAEKHVPCGELVGTTECITL